MASVAFLLRCSALTVFFFALIFAAVSDAKARQIPNSAPLLLLLAGVFNILSGGPTTHLIISALLGLFLGGFPLFILALFRSSVGGGDVKLAASAGFVLGGFESYLALIVALIGFVLFGLFRQPVKKKTKAFSLPFAPFYSASCVCVVLFFGLFRGSLLFL